MAIYKFRIIIIIIFFFLKHETHALAYTFKSDSWQI